MHSILCFFRIVIISLMYQLLIIIHAFYCTCAFCWHMKEIIIVKHVGPVLYFLWITFMDKIDRYADDTERLPSRNYLPLDFTFAFHRTSLYFAPVQEHE